MHPWWTRVPFINRVLFIPSFQRHKEKVHMSVYSSSTVVSLQVVFLIITLYNCTLFHHQLSSPRVHHQWNKFSVHFLFLFLFWGEKGKRCVHGTKTYIPSYSETTRKILCDWTLARVGSNAIRATVVIEQ